MISLHCPGILNYILLLHRRWMQCKPVRAVAPPLPATIATISAVNFTSMKLQRACCVR